MYLGRERDAPLYLMREHVLSHTFVLRHSSHTQSESKEQDGRHNQDSRDLPCLVGHLGRVRDKVMGQTDWTKMEDK